MGPGRMGNAKKKERTLKTVGLLTTRPSSLAIHVILKPSCAANRLHALVVLGTQLQAREDGAAGNQDIRPQRCLPIIEESGIRLRM
jgi:hypothetical protein